MFKPSKLLKPTFVGRLILGVYLLASYFRQEGWINSLRQMLPVDAIGNAIPWWTYSSIHFLEKRIKSDFLVFEYGSGNSTLWFSQRVSKIISTEHDHAWYDSIKKKFDLVPQIEYLHREESDRKYSMEILNYVDQFDIIVIDGVDRVACAMNALQALKNDGVIIWDNTDRSIYQEGFDFLESKGFKRIDFWGLGPINSYASCTSVLYRQNNCLKI